MLAFLFSFTHVKLYLLYHWWLSVAVDEAKYINCFTVNKANIDSAAEPLNYMDTKNQSQ